MELTLAEFNELIAESIGGKPNDDHLLLESWTSMQTLIMVSVIDEKFDVLISQDALKSSVNSADLYNKIELLKEA